MPDFCLNCFLFRRCPYCTCDYSYGHGQGTEAASVIALRTVCFPVMYPDVREKLCYSLCLREICFLLQARGQRGVRVSPRCPRPQPPTPCTPSIRCKLLTPAPGPLPEGAGRGRRQLRPPQVQAALGKPCLSLYARALQLLQSVLVDTASPTVRVVLCTGHRGPPGAWVKGRLPGAGGTNSPQVRLQCSSTLGGAGGARRACAGLRGQRVRGTWLRGAGSSRTALLQEAATTTAAGVLLAAVIARVPGEQRRGVRGSWGGRAGVGGFRGAERGGVSCPL